MFIISQNKLFVISQCRTISKKQIQLYWNINRLVCEETNVTHILPLTEVSLMFTNSKRSYRFLCVDEFFMTYSAYSIACTALSLDYSYHSPYSLLSSGMRWHFLLIICYYLYALFDMTAPHFPWVPNYTSVIESI